MNGSPPRTPTWSSEIVFAQSGVSVNARPVTSEESRPARSPRRSDEFQHPLRPYRTRRLFAGSAALLLVLVVVAVIPREVRAEAAQPPAQPLPSRPVTYGPGRERIVNPDGTVVMSYLRTYQRWDGAWRPASSQNRSTGERPYHAT